MKLYQLTNSQPKSKMKASEGLSTGKYKFYTSSPIQSKYCEKAIYKSEALIFGTGGNPSVHYCNEPFSTSTDCLVLYGNNDKVNLELIYYYLFSNIHILENGFKGAGLKHISANYILNINIDLLNESVQNEILNKIKLIDKLISKKKEQLNKLDIEIKSRFVEMFGDPEINPMEWSEKPLSELLNVISGYAFKSELFAESGIPVLRIGNINTGIFQAVNMVYWKEDKKLERYKVYPGDLVMSLTGTVGKDDYGNVCILDNEYDAYYLNQRNAKFQIKGNINKYYLSELLKFPQIKKRLTGISRGVRQANISNQDILNLQVPIPNIEKQVQYGEFVHLVNKSKFESKLYIKIIRKIERRVAYDKF